MKKNKTQNFALLSIVALLACCVFLLNKKDKIDTETRLPIDVRELRSITIQHSTEIKLEKKGEDWLMTAPQKGQIKPERIEKILTHLMLPLESGFAADESDISLYGLDKPRMQVQLNDELLSFGALSTMQQMHYIEFKGQVYLARPFLQISFDKGVDDLLLKTTE